MSDSSKTQQNLSEKNRLEIDNIVNMSLYHELYHHYHPPTMPS